MLTGAFLHPSGGTLAGAVLLALALDRWLGEPPARCHPVVWMGRLLGWAGSRCAPVYPTGGVPGDGIQTCPRAHATGAGRAFLAGTLAWLFGAAVVAGIAFALQMLLLGWAAGAAVWAVLGLGVLLKPLFAWRMLREEVAAVEAALGQSLAQGRQRLSWLCSRDVSLLDAAQVRETALETLAENLNDSVVAPLFWFTVAGLPGAALYRWANTADAMWGYLGERQGRDWTWAGKWAARTDDVLSWLPARLTGLLLHVLGYVGGGAGALPVAARWRAWRAQARVTPSPNGGWPMAALALALGVRLGKPGVYVLNGLGRAPEAADTQVGLRLAQWVVWALAATALCCAVWPLATSALKGSP